MLTPDKNPFQQFRSHLNKLFDVAPSDLYQRLNASHRTNLHWEEDWEWYQGMLKIPQVGCMTSRDVSLANRVQRILDREAAIKERATADTHVPSTSGSEESSKLQASSGHTWKDRWDYLPTPPTFKSPLKEGHQLRQSRQSDGFNPCQYSSNSETEDPAYEPSDWHKRQESSKLAVITLPVAPRTGLLRATTATATRFSVSAAAHLAIVTNTVKAAGGNLDDFTASHSAAKRHRKQEQATKATFIKDSFTSKWKGWPKVQQWDGKVMELQEAQGIRRYQDVNAVVLSIPGSTMSPTAIGMPIVDRGTCHNLAISALDKVAEWGDINEIVGGVFDTTSANTGLHEGGMTHVENHFRKALLWLACQYHIAELHLKHPYESIMRRATGPDEPLFKAFKHWFMELRCMDTVEYKTWCTCTTLHIFKSLS